MIRKTLLFKLTLLALFIFISGCSPTPVPKNKWQYDAVSSLNKFQMHFLQNQRDRAKADLSHARDFASQSAHLQTRINIELTACAMQLSVLQSSQCEGASLLLALEPSPSQLAYLHLLTSTLSEDEIDLLPNKYQDFAESLLSKDTDDINSALENIKPVSSRLIASALSIDIINDENIHSLINELSYHGYKNPLVVWLSVQMQKESDPKEKAKLKAKIAVLTSN